MTVASLLGTVHIPSAVRLATASESRSDRLRAAGRSFQGGAFDPDSRVILSCATADVPVDMDIGHVRAVE